MNRHGIQRVNRWAAVPILVVAVLVSGCSVRQEVIINAQGGGTAEVSIRLSTLILSYYDDLTAALTGIEAEAPVFDQEAIRAAFEERPGISLSHLDAPTRGALSLAVVFDDLSAALAQEGEPEVVRFSRSGSERTLRISLDRSAVDRFLNLAPTTGNDAVSFILPPDDPSVTEQEYRGQLTWALEEYADREAVDRILQAATISVTVKPEGDVVRQHGGEIVQNTVVFTIPVLWLLTIPEPVVYEITYRVR